VQVATLILDGLPWSDGIDILDEGPRDERDLEGMPATSKCDENLTVLAGRSSVALVISGSSSPDCVPWLGSSSLTLS